MKNMLANYNSYIQFIAAIYLTLSIDNTLFRSIWSMTYVENLFNAFSNVKLDLPSKFEENFRNIIKTKAQSIEKQSRIRGSFMLSICVALLIFSGIEISLLASITDKLVIQSFLIPYSIFTSVLFISIIWLICWQTNYIKVFISILAIIITTFLSLLWKDNIFFLLNDQVKGKLVGTIDIITVLIITIPLLYQFLINWLYSDIYYYYVGNKINEEISEYRNAINANSPENVLQKYTTAFTQAYFDSKNKGSDTVLTEVNKIFNEQLEIVIQSPRIIELIKYHITHLKTNKSTPFEFKDNNPIQNDTVPRSDYKRNDSKTLMEKFKQEKRINKTKMKDFCKANNLEFTALKKEYEDSLASQRNPQKDR